MEQYTIAYVMLQKAGMRSHVWAGQTKAEMDATLANIRNNPMITVVFAGLVKERFFPGRGHLRPYPLCEYAKALCVPDDVKPDWLSGAVEALEWVLGVPVESYDKDRGEREFAQNQTEAKAGLLNLHDRFGV